MKPVVKIQSIDVQRVKNVKRGQVVTNATFSELSRATVLGVYGQNGSGKTALVTAFRLFKQLLQGEPLPLVHEHVLMYKEVDLSLHVQLIVHNEFGRFYLLYEATLQKGPERLQVVEERLCYREDQPKKRYKELVSKRGEQLALRTTNVMELAEKKRVICLFANHYAEQMATSFVFRPQLRDVYDSEFNEVERTVMRNIAEHFNRDFHVIDQLHNGLVLANVLVPFSIHIEQSRGHIPYELADQMLLPQPAFATLQRVVQQINYVLRQLIVGLEIHVETMYEERMSDGQVGIRFEFLAVRGDVRLPLRCESAGTLKLISVLSTLIAVYNNANACVVIDELDAGVFEYLLGEILEVLEQNGKGQLFFTSHNLRVLEVLHYKNLWFTTTNESERFIQLRGIKPLNNSRDVYLRAVQLGGQREELYRETDSYEMKRAFQQAWS